MSTAVGYRERVTTQLRRTAPVSTITPVIAVPALRRRVVVVALIVTVVLIAVTIPSAAPLSWDPVSFVAAIAVCLAGGAAVLWPVTAGIALGALLTATLLSGNAEIGMASLAAMVVLGHSAALGRYPVTALLAVWYYTVMVGMTIATATEPADVTVGVYFWLVYLVFPIGVGIAIRTLLLRTERVREQRTRDLAEQRRRIARDLHDTAVYATTLMVMRAEGARLRGDLPAEAATDLEFIASTGRQATEDLRSMLGVLRTTNDVEERANPEPISTAGSITEQAERLREAGFRVKLSVPDKVPEASDPIISTLRQVVGEAVSNIILHGDPSGEVALMLEANDHEIEALLVNAVPPEPFEPAVPHQPLGLIGMRERAEAHGGTFETTSTPETWMTHLTLPLRR